MDGTLALQGMGDAQRNGPVVRPPMAVQGMATVSRKVWVVADTRQFCCLG